MIRLTQLRKARQRGYSLAEMLVVVAIIGMISLVAVPNFMSMYRSARFKSAMRNFITSVRSAQQRAISENCRTKISFVVNGKGYQIAREVTNATTGVRTWQTMSRLPLDTRGDGAPDATFFVSTGFPDSDSPGDGINDVIFNPNGTVTVPVSPNLPEIVIKSGDGIPKPTYTITFSLTGQVRAT